MPRCPAIALIERYLGSICLWKSSSAYKLSQISWSISQPPSADGQLIPLCAFNGQTSRRARCLSRFYLHNCFFCKLHRIPATPQLLCVMLCLTYFMQFLLSLMLASSVLAGDICCSAPCSFSLPALPRAYGRAGSTYDRAVPPNTTFANLSFLWICWIWQKYSFDATFRCDHLCGQACYT